MKTCRVCFQDLPRTSFYKALRMKDGLHSLCKACWNGRCKDYYAANKERIKALQRAYRQDPEVREMYKLKKIARHERVKRI